MAPLYVACLCAQWCGVCREWRPAFEALRDRLPPDLPVQWAWIDVEDQADELGDYEPPDFPVLAVQRGGELLFCAPLAQQPGVWLRLITELAGLDAVTIAQRAKQLAAAELPDLRALIAGRS